MSQCVKESQEYYPTFQNSTAISLCQFQENFLLFVTKITNYEYVVSVSCFLINVFHILVLTRKSMRTSSINILMAAVALFDVCSYLLNFETIVVGIISSFSECLNKMSYKIIFMDNFLYVVNQYARRCSAWLVFSVAVIRTLVIRNPMSPKYAKLSDPSTSLRVIFGVSSICVIFSINTAFESEIEIDDILLSECDSKNVESYALVISELFRSNDGFLMKVSTFSTAIVSHIIPCILFPIITTILISELSKVDERRKNSTVSKSNDSRKTTKLVFYNTILFLIAEIPFEISMAITWLFYDVPGLQLIFTYSRFLFPMVLTNNTSSHFVICVLMSLQYLNLN